LFWKRPTTQPVSLQLEESNRTLTVDVANLANEKEELNNHLKDMQQRESSRKLSPALRLTLYNLTRTTVTEVGFVSFSLW